MESGMKRFSRFIFCGLALSILLYCTLAFGATIHVPGDQSTIQAGIDTAEDGDTVLVADGIYTGESNKNLDLLGKAITVKSENGPEACIIDCEGNGRGFYFHNNEKKTSVISGFTIRNGYIGTRDNPAVEGGYDTAAAGADADGGGILIKDSSPTIDDCIISDCTVEGSGGGIAVLGDPENASSSPVIKDCDIYDNRALVSEDGSGGKGGGLALHGNASPVVKECTIRDNQALEGGGVSLDSDGIVPASLSNCVITDNRADSDGGAVNAGGNAAPAITNCTISRNDAVGGDIVLDTETSAVIVNCIIYDDRSSSVEQIVLPEGRPLPVVAYSNIQGGLPGEITGIENISEDPLFVAPDDGDFRLTSASPCIDKATPAMAADEDVDAEERSRGFAPDMGAHENQSGPEAEFVSENTAGPAPLEVSFVDQSTADTILRSWDFGDGTTSTERNPIHTYDTPGTYTVKLIVTGPGGFNSEEKAGHIVVSEPAQTLSAAFTGVPTSGTAPLAVNFADQSTGEITGWAWDFGDGATGTEQSPSHTYNNPGTYSVTLTVTGPGGENSVTKIDYITVSEAAPVAAFTGAPLNGTAPLAVSFTDQSTGEITGWGWNFGDGETGTEQNPSHTYNNPGTYNVTLTVTGPGGNNSETKVEYITVSEAAPVAAFTGAPTAGTAPLAVSFTDQSTGEITEWAWDFGDGATSTEQNPSHTYNNPGTYSVTLTVTGPGGENSETKVDYIVAGNPAPMADFTCSRTTGRFLLFARFRDQSEGVITSWLWDFGDGATSARQNPYHFYWGSGTYTVSLTVTGPGGESTETKVDFITIKGWWFD